MDEPMPDTESDAPSELTAIVDDFDDRTRNFVNNVAKLFGLLDQPKVSLSEERRKIWKENLEEIVKPPEPCQIAIVGQTGCGKSSLLNAILDAPVAPASSSGRACTSVPTEFSFKDIPHFEAIIHFRDVEECKAELLALHADFSLSSDGSQHDSKSLMELGARLKAVCPHVTEESLESLDVDQILSQEGLKGILGQEEYISSSDPLELQKMLYQRMTGNGADVTGDPSSWSLAKKIQVFGKFPALSTGVTLVDVPGSGDANSVRNNVATEYLVKSDALILVVEQKRAIDNLDALEKLKMLIKRLFSDGRLADSSLSLVFTMADTPVDFHEVDQYTPYGDENTIRCLHEQITTVDRYKAEKQSCEKKLRAMRKNTTKAALELKKRIKDINARLDLLVPQYVHQCKQLKSLLAKIRSKRVVIGFEHILGEICGALSIDHLPPLQIFCVGTHDYLELQRSNEPVIFTDEQGTQIPNLREHIEAYGAARNLQHITRVLTDTNGLFDQVCQHFDDNSRELVDLGSVEKTLKRNLKKLGQEGQTMLRERTAEVERQIGRFVTSHLTPQVIEARDSCKKVFNDIAKDNHWRAYAACMRRQGEHGTIDLNDDLIKHIYPKIYEEWFHVFTKRIPAILTQLIEEDLMGAIVEAIKELGKNAPPHRQDSIQRALRSVFTNEKVKGCARKIRKDISLRQRDISHSFKARIKETLKPHYKTVGKESGPGMYQRMKNANERYARESCGHLFECSVRGASSDLRGKLCDDVQVKLEKFLKRILNDICQAYLSALKATHFHTEKKEREKIMIWVREQQTVLAQLLNELPQETLNRR